MCPGRDEARRPACHLRPERENTGARARVLRMIKVKKSRASFSSGILVRATDDFAKVCARLFAGDLRESVVLSCASSCQVAMGALGK
jgi:hypothetical protein